MGQTGGPGQGGTPGFPLPLLSACDEHPADSERETGQVISICFAGSSAVFEKNSGRVNRIGYVSRIRFEKRQIVCAVHEIAAFQARIARGTPCG